MLRVAIDLRALYWRQSGIGRNLDSLLKILTRSRPAWEYHVFFSNREDAQRAKDEGALNSPRIQIHCFPSPALVFKFILLPVWLALHKPDVFVSPTPEMLPVRVAPTVLYIYDTIPEKNPSWTPFRVRILAKTGILRKAAEVADCVVTISEYSKRELLRLYGLHESKIRVIPCILDERFKTIDSEKARERTFELVGGRYRVVLALKHERMAEFLKSCAILFERLDADVHVALVGRPMDWKAYEHLLSPAIRDRFHLLDWVSDYDLICLYNAATCFVFPSYEEGFGYPPLEAMACGTPVIAYRGSSVDEVVGSAAIQVSAGNVKGLASAIERVITNPELRRTLVEKGLARARLFKDGQSPQKLIQLVEALPVPRTR
jgi:glycosyltransferase involved in cell wall biosynthesis